MPSLNDVAAAHTGLGPADLHWLHQLVADWQLLADLSFADLLLWLPDRDGSRWHVGAQMRPTTGSTVYADDLVGTSVPRGAREQIDAAFDEVRICRESDPDWHGEIPVREETIPVVREGRVLAVVSRHTNLASTRTPSRLEMTYLQTAGELARMVAEGRFPLPGGVGGLDALPRAGDGLIRVDAEGVVTYASPNALSAYRRLGLAADLEGVRLGQVTAELAPRRGPVDEALHVVASGRASRVTEVEANGATLQLRAIPLRPGGRRIGAVVLVHDVTELRQRDRELVTKDATIREIHHRVKNNLQTVAALLRLQARRIGVPAGRAALEEAVRRVGSIALVHDTLSHSLDEVVDFDDIAERIVAMAGEMSGPEGRVRPVRTGRFGELPAEVATPLAMVLSELVQNALVHGLRGRGGRIEVAARREQAGRAGDAGQVLSLTVTDDGVGLPEGFDVQNDANLGLQIVRTLVVGELGGQLRFERVRPSGTAAVTVVPLPTSDMVVPRPPEAAGAPAE